MYQLRWSQHHIWNSWLMCLRPVLESHSIALSSSIPLLLSACVASIGRHGFQFPTSVSSTVPTSPHLPAQFMPQWFFSQTSNQSVGFSTKQSLSFGDGAKLTLMSWEVRICESVGRSIVGSCCQVSIEGEIRYCIIFVKITANPMRVAGVIGGKRRDTWFAFSFWIFKILLNLPHKPSLGYSSRLAPHDHEIVAHNPSYPSKTVC